MCRISDGVDTVSFSLEHTIDPENWDDRNEETTYDDFYHHLFLRFKMFLRKRYSELMRISRSATDALNVLRKEADTLIYDSGIDGITREMFDSDNQSYAIPPYRQFVQAFEQFSGLGSMDYSVKAVGNTVQFYSKNGLVWEIDTYRGLIFRLHDIVEGRLVQELNTETDKSNWSRIFTNACIDKYVFIPKLLVEWERYWDVEYADTQQKLGETIHLKELKQMSWHYFQVFMSCYEATYNSIDLAYVISEDNLYPLTVITMLQLLGTDTCYNAYCALEFGPDSEWTSIILRSDVLVAGDEVGTQNFEMMPTFFIREAKT